MVVADLEAEGFLVAKENITHSYPHCWRCKHPIIYRATEQWFCSVDAIKDARRRRPATPSSGSPTGARTA